MELTSIGVLGIRYVFISLLSHDIKNNNINKNIDFKSELQEENTLDKNSIDKQAKQFADFFNGEIVNLE